MRRLAAVLTTAAALLVTVPVAAPAQATGAPVTAPAQANAPTVNAKGAIVINDSTGTPLWSKSAGTARPMASTTKIMTAVVVLETKGVNLNRLITVQQAYRDYVATHGASSADLRTGDKLTVRQLLYALMLPSGCDAAYALADNFGHGSTRAARTADFIAQMNAKATSLWLENTHYDSFDGIAANGATYTTPRSLAVLARHALDNDTFRAVVGSVHTLQKATNVNRTYTWYNTNGLLGAYKGAIGIKTGTSTPAGHCLVFAAERNQRIVVGVLLADDNRFADAAKLLDWAYGNTSGTRSATTTFVPRALPAGAPTD
ncbi:D-alanyl-D-alanine carboxypeptidase family protein [Streptomyces sp. NPDC054933]